MLTVERLREILNYDRETGVFTWRIKTCSKVVAGTEAGYADSTGRRFIRVDGVLHQAHRLAFLHVTGEWPSKVVDHMDLDPGNNRWANLRDVTRLVNQQNRHDPQANTTTGFLGVTRDKRRPGFIARIKLPGKSAATHLGQFSTAEAAHAAYVEAKRAHHEGCTL